jgi:hypothetical protein
MTPLSWHRPAAGIVAAVCLLAAGARMAHADQPTGYIIDGHSCPNVGSPEQIAASLKDPVCTSYLFEGPDNQGPGCYPDGVHKVECADLGIERNWHLVIQTEDRTLIMEHGLTKEKCFDAVKKANHQHPQCWNSKDEQINCSYDIFPTDVLSAECFQ